jgi:hypothetical protein
MTETLQIAPTQWAHNTDSSAYGAAQVIWDDRHPWANDRDRLSA